jgi:acetyl esterase/lipase
MRAIAFLASICMLAAAPGAWAADSICTRPALAQLTQAQPGTLQGATSHTYKSIGGAQLRLHVFAPAVKPARPVPAVVFFYGGGWMWGEVSSFLPYARRLAQLGMVTVLADYRVYCRHGVGITEEMADAKSAIRWVRDHARELQVDPRRIAASGGSAGGHLALSTALFTQFSDEPRRSARSARPDALLLLYPCVDETSADERGISEPALAGHGRDVSPLFHVARGLPPMLVLQGTGDAIHSSVKNFCDAAARAGNHCELVEYEGAPHGFIQMRDGDLQWQQRSMVDIERYLRGIGYL